MKATDSFKTIIQAHLEDVAAKDPLFAETLKKPAKSIDDCITYILNTVKASGKNGFADEEVFNMAIHYYDEDDIKVGSPVKGQVVVNRAIEPSKDKMAKAIASRESPPEIPKPTKKGKPQVQVENQIALF